VPAVYGEEVSGMRMHKVIPAITGQLFRGFWRRILLKYVLYSFSPVALLLFSGLFLFGLGSLAGVYLTINRYVWGHSPSAGTALLAVAPWLAGIHMLINAMLLDIQESPDRPGYRPSGPSRPGGRG
jgi:hypothetical protein